MKNSLFLILFTITIAISQDKQDTYENYEAQNFFDSGDINTFFQKNSGELLKKIIVNGQEYLMQQDGDLYDEDVATIDEPILGIKEEKYSFSKSKRLLALQIYPQHQKAFYSNCKYIITGKKLVPIHKTCGFHYRKNKNRSERIEWEHIVPAWHFGHQLKCWQNGGRMTCRQTNTKFRQMEADMHNLVPAIGEINGDRSNFKYGMIEAEKRIYGKVNMEIDFHGRKAEPRDSVFGDIARTYFYMRDRYGLKISKSQEKMFIAWNNLDPVSSWEKKKNQLVKKIQGDENLYVTNYRKMEQLGSSTTDTKQPTEFNEIKEELNEKYGDILSKFSPTLSGFIITILAIIVWYRRRNSKPETTRNETTTTTTKPPVDKKEEPIKTKTFMLVSKLGDVAISFNDKEEVIIEAIDKTNPKQHWIFTKANKKKSYVFIESPSTGKVIEVAQANTNDGAKIILNKKKSRKNDHQEWKLEHSDDKGYLFIVNRWSLNVLDVKYKKTKDGTKLQSFHKKVRGTENQEWKVVQII
ncbi:MAG: hypothetical protein GXO60_00180 [Epsilonproteobacteria bacterium]|nr:hypothetical protein [Campylobacterota bacterium]